MTSATAPANTPQRRWLRVLLRTGAIVAAVVICLVLVVRVLAATDIGRGVAESWIEALSVSGQSIELEGLTGDLLGRLTVDRLEVSDAEGIWLSADELTVSWSPWSFLGGHLNIDEVTSQRLSILRHPELVTSETDDGASGGLPFDTLTLERLTLIEIELADGVAGQAAFYSAEGSLRQAGDEGRLGAVISAMRSEGDRLDVDLSWGADDVPLTGTADLSAPAGGMLAALLRLGPDQSMTVDLNAEGTFSDWTAQAQVDIDGQAALVMRARRSDGSETLDAEIDLSPHPLTQALAERIGAALTVTASRSESGPLQADLETPALQVSVRGEDTARLPGIASIDASTTSAELLIGRDDIRLDELRLTGILDRTGPGGATFDGEIFAGALAYADWSAASLAGPVTFRQNGDTVGLVTRLSTSGFVGPEAVSGFLGHAPRLALDLSSNLNSGRSTVSTLALDFPGLSLVAAGDVQTDLSTIDLEGRLAVNGPVLGVAPVSADIGWSANAKAGDRPQLITEANVSNLPALPGPVSSWATETGRMSLTASLAADGTVHIDEVEASSGETVLTGAGSIDAAGLLSGAFNLSAPGLADASLTSAPIEANLAFSGQPQQLDVSLNAQAANLTVQGTRLDNLDVSTVAEWTGALAGVAELTAETDAAPVTLQTAYSISDAGWSVSDFEGQWAALMARADVSGAFGTLESLSGMATISGSAPTLLPAESVQIDASILGDTISIDAMTGGLSMGALSGADLTLTAAGTLADVAFQLGIENGDLVVSDIQRPLALTATGNVSDLLAGVSALDLVASLQLGRFDVTTSAPLTLEQTENGRRMSFALEGFGGSANGRVETSPDGAVVDAAWAGLDVEALAALASQIGPRGQVGGTLVLDTTAPEPSGHINAELSGIVDEAGRPLPLGLTLLGAIAGNELTLNLTDRDSDEITVDGQARLPLDLRGGPLGLPTWSGAPLIFDLGVTGEIEPLVAVAMPQGLGLAGQADIALEGSWPAPENPLTGYANLSDGRFEDGGLGFILDDIAAEVTFTTQAVELQALSARSPNGGDVSGQGRFAFDGSTNSLVISANRLRLLDQRGLRATASGDLSLDTNESGFALTGDLTVDRADIDLDRLPSQTSFATLDVVFPEDVPTAETEPSPETNRVFQLDVDVSAPGRLFVSGSGLDAELSLDSKVTGTLEDLRIVGRANIIRGDFDFAGKRFVFQDSVIRVDGDVSSAELDIQATRSTDLLDAVINITGSVERPEIQLTSTPELPEDEVLSRVLFGRSPAELSPLQTAQLAVALAGLSGGGGPNLLGDLEDTLGLDTLDVNFSETGGTTVTTGRYLSDDVYLELETGASGLPRVIIEWRPLDNVEVDADLTPSVEQELSIKWTRDFD